jgi:hypothetical protein
LTVRQTSTASPTDDIFQITSSDGATKYFYVDKDGNVSTSGTSGQTLTLTPLTDTTALTLVGTNVTSQPLQYVNSKNSSATSGIINMAYGVAQTLTGSVIGIRTDLSTNVTATNQSVTGYQITLPGATNTSGTQAYKGIVISGGSINENGGTATTFTGADITIPALTQTSGTLTAYGANITTPSSITTGGSAYGVNIAATGVGAGSLYGVNVSDISAGAGTEVGMQIGSGWDTNLLFNDTTTRVAVADGGTITILDSAGNSLCTITDSGSAGNLDCTGTIGGSGTVGFWSKASTTLSPATANDIVSIATTNTSGADLAITNTGAYTGTGIFNLTANSATTGNLASITGTGLTTGEILNIDATYAPSNGSTNEGIDINITHSPTTSADNFTGIDTQVTDGTALANTVYGANIGTISTGNAAKTFYGIQSSIQSSSTTADTLTSLHAWGSVTGAISTGTRFYTGVAGNNASTAASTGGTLNLFGGRFTPSSTLSNPGVTDTATNNVYGIYTSPTLTLASDCTTNCTSNQYGLYVANGTSSTNGTSTKYGIYIEDQSGADTNIDLNFSASPIVRIGNAGVLTFTEAGGNNTLCTITDSSNVGDLSCTGNITGASTGTVGYWSRSGTTLSPATANDIVSIANSTTSGADFAITNTGVYTGTGIFNLTANSATTGNLASLTGTGFTTGEILDITGTWAPSDGSTNEAIDINITHSPTSVADTFKGVDLSITDNTSLANSVFGIDAYTVLSGNAAKTSYGLSGAVTSSSTTADTLRGVAGWTTSTGAITTGTRSSIGVYGRPVSTAASTGGTLNMYGGYFDSSSTLSNPGASDTSTNNIYGVYTKTTATLAADCTTNCTTNQYGLYVDNGTSDTDGTSAKYGIYINTQSGADTNYALYSAASANSYFAGNLGIGTTPSGAYRAQVSRSITSSDNSYNGNLSASATVSSVTDGYTYVGLNNFLTSTHSSNAATLRGIDAKAYFSSQMASEATVGVNSAYAIYAEKGITGSSPTGTISNAFGLYSAFYSSATGTPAVTVSNNYGLYITNQGTPSGSPSGISVGNAIGLYVAAQSGATSTNYAAVFAGAEPPSRTDASLRASSS